MSAKHRQLSRALKASPQFAECLGFFLIAFSRCEAALNHTICAFLKLQGHNGGLEVISSVRDFGQRMMLLNRLSKRLLPTEAEQAVCSKIIGALQFLNNERVDLVHGEFVQISEEGERYHTMRTVAQQSDVQRRLGEFTPEFLIGLAKYGLLVEKALGALRSNLAPGGLVIEMPSLDTRPERQSPSAR